MWSWEHSVPTTADGKVRRPHDTKERVFLSSLPFSILSSPLLFSPTSPDLFVHCCDFSPAAVHLVKVSNTVTNTIMSFPSPPPQDHHLYDPKRCSVFLHDMSSAEQLPLPAESVDYVVLIFTLSAIPFPRYSVLGSHSVWEAVTVLLTTEWLLH